MADMDRVSGAPDLADHPLDARVVEALVGTSDPAERAGVLTAWGDAVRAAGADDTAQARLAWQLALALMRAGAAARESPTTTVDEYALALAGRAGLRVDPAALDRSHRQAASRGGAAGHAAAYAQLCESGRCTMRDLVEQRQLGPEELRRALLVAYDDLELARRARDQAQRDAVELAAARSLTQSLGEELERDEWIRARLRQAKATRPAKAVIAARKRLATRRPR